MSILVLRSSWWGRERERWMLWLVCLPDVSCLLCGFMGLSAVCGCDISQSYSLNIFGCHSCEQRWLWWVCTFAWSSLSFRHRSKFLCGGSNGDWMPICASSEGSGESAHLHRLTLVFVTVQNLLCCLKWRFVCFSRQQLILWWVRINLCRQSHWTMQTADPGVASSIPARSHTFVEIDHEIISTVILLPSADSFKKGCCQLQAKVCAQITG